MRTLFVLRGAPGSGKTTWVNKNKLVTYTISLDNVRMLFQSPIQTIYGKEAINHKSDAQIKKYLYEVLEQRMKNAEFTVIDAANIRAEELMIYYELAQRYRYRIYVIDFTKVPQEKVLKQNNSRLTRKRVPTKAMEMMLEEIEKERVPDCIPVLDPAQYEKVFMKPVDLSGYKKIHHIGDIHGCYDIFSEALKENGNLRDDEYYIFLGDYTDRGEQNDEVVRFLLKNHNRKNIVLCEGNHERWMYNWLMGSDEFPDGFRNTTLPQIEQFEKNKLKEVYNALKECFWYRYKGKEVFCSHGGIAKIPNHPEYISGYQYTHGVGLFSDMETLASVFAKLMGKSVYEVFGHRNSGDYGILLNDHVFCLENGVEKGGTLRWLTLDGCGFTGKEYKDKKERD